jgi:hypothetical protein
MAERHAAKRSDQMKPLRHWSGICFGVAYICRNERRHAGKRKRPCRPIYVLGSEAQNANESVQRRLNDVIACGRGRKFCPGNRFCREEML